MASDSATGPFSPDVPFFAVTLRPHRSLSENGFRLVMIGVGLGALVQAVPMFLLGAWPVSGFFGLDLLILYICFRLSFARARQTELVELSRIELRVRRFCWRGHVSEHRFNPFWVRLQTIEDPDYGMQKVLLVQRSREVEIGAFLAPFERADFARSFGQALARARG